MDSNNFLNRRLACVVTGASRGIGKELALRLARRVGDHSAFLIVARNSDDLQRTGAEIKARNSSVHVETLTMDLARYADHNAAFSTAMHNLLRRSDKYDAALLVHNAASLGPIDKGVDRFVGSAEIRDYLELNFVSFALLNNDFLKMVDDCAPMKVIVNFTSLAAVKPMAGFGLYSTGKAAREGFMRSLAADRPDIRVLNYSPGPVATDMIEQVARETWNEETKSRCQNTTDDFKLLTCDQTVDRLLNILDDNSYETGGRIDYFDP